ncbi:MAG: mechanosensitive ion channel domain-containing protein [Pseudomonadota bacterium]
MAGPVFAALFRALVVVFVGASCLAVSTAISFAQDAPEEPSPEPVPEDDGVFLAPVVIDGETLFMVRGFTALPATERAKAIQDRIIEFADLPEEREVTVTARDSEFGKSILANGRMVHVTTTADAEYEQADIDVLAGLHVEAIEAAIEAYRMRRTEAARVDSAFAAFGWTAVFLVLSTLLLKFRKRIARRVGKRLEARFGGLEEATGSVVRRQALASLGKFVTSVLLWVTLFVLLYYYLSFVLLAFAETRPFAQLLLTYVSEPLMNVVRGFVGFVPNLISLAIIALVARYCIKGLRLLLANVEAGTIKLGTFEPHWVTPTFNIGRGIVVVIALIFAYPYIPGSESRAFQGFTILAGIMVSLGSNSVISNIVAGLFVIYRRSTNLGDRIKVGEQVGDVVEIRLMETLIKSIKNEMISIPNAQLLNSEVVNYSRKIDGRGILVHTTVGIGYEEAQDKVEAMLVEAARRTDGLKNTPTPFVLWTGLTDYAINYQINAFTTRGSIIPKILSDLHRNIVDVFNENGVQIMTPSYMADPDQVKIPSEAWDGALASSSQ